ncbi:MAG: epimerase [Planctomycetota bacterium]|nr:MAG: epimerase [Planctomycetota bacterium]
MRAARGSVSLACVTHRTTRRTFGLAALAIGAAAACRSAPRGSKPQKLLVLGGTGFTGPFTVEQALARGWQVSIFTRGKRNPELFGDDARVEKLVGDRDPDVGDGLAALRGRSFDLVIDNSGHVPRHMRASVELLAPVVGHYLFVSSLSAYASHAVPDADEDAPLAELEAPSEDFTGPAFGPLKALCERELLTAMPGRSTVVRPGLIVGPRDFSDRFTYWPLRCRRGGDVLAPGTPDDPIQLIDGRDLSAFLLDLVERRTSGVFNALGPRGGLRWGEVLDACVRAGAHAGGAAAKLEWVSAEFLREHGAQPWSDLPVWMPPEGELAGFHRRNVDRAVAAGLRFRPIEQTCRDTLAWWDTLDAARRDAPPKRGLSSEREVELLAAWRSRALR